LVVIEPEFHWQKCHAPFAHTGTGAGRLVEIDLI
jgi:hypothetical protein